MTLFFRGSANITKAKKILSNLVSLGGGIASEGEQQAGCFQESMYYYVSVLDNSITWLDSNTMDKYRNNRNLVIIDDIGEFEKVCPFSIGDSVKIKNFYDLFKYTITNIEIVNLDNISFYLNEDDIPWKAEELELI